MILEQKGGVYLWVPEKDAVLIPFKSIRSLLLPPDCQQVKDRQGGRRWRGKRCRDEGEGRAVDAHKRGLGWTCSHQVLIWPPVPALLRGLPSPSLASVHSDHTISHQNSIFPSEKIIENCSCSNSTTEKRNCWHSHFLHEKGAVQASIRWMLSPFSFNEDKWSDTMQYPVPRTVIFQTCLPVPSFLQHFLSAEYSP